MKDRRYCEDCRYYCHRPIPCGGDNLCTHFDAGPANTVRRDSAGVDCESVRGDGDRCGRAGRYWESIE